MVVRYTDLPFPSYAFVPGQKPHPRKHPQGHSHGTPEPSWTAFAPEDWEASVGFLYGVDLFNAGYWWESHEQWEALWLAVGKTTTQGYFLRGLIQLAAAHLKHHVNNLRGALRLYHRAQDNLSHAPSLYCGVCKDRLLQDSLMFLQGSQSKPTCLVLSKSESS